MNKFREYTIYNGDYNCRHEIRNIKLQFFRFLRAKGLSFGSEEFSKYLEMFDYVLTVMEDEIRIKKINDLKYRIHERRIEQDKEKDKPSEGPYYTSRYDEVYFKGMKELFGDDK